MNYEKKYKKYKSKYMYESSEIELVERNKEYLPVATEVKQYIEFKEHDSYLLYRVQKFVKEFNKKYTTTPLEVINESNLSIAVPLSLVVVKVESLRSSYRPKSTFVQTVKEYLIKDYDNLLGRILVIRYGSTYASYQFEVI